MAAQTEKVAAAALVGGSETALHSHAGGGDLSYIHLGKTGSAQQDHGGPDGTEVVVSWDNELHKGTDFTHDNVTNNSRIQCDFTGRIQVVGVVGVEQGGAARTTTMSRFSVNGGATNVRGTTRNYSRGSAYADLSVEWDFELDVSTGDYVELITAIDDTDATYVMNSIVAECDLVVRRIDVGIKGADGSPGTPGADGDITWEGDWSAGEYTANQAVQHGGTSYVATTTTSHEPPHADWDILAEKGDKGDTGGISEYMVPIWAEENSTLSADTYEWAFGNGADTPADGGLTIYVPSGWTCTVVAMSLRIGGGTATVELVYNGTPQGSAAQVEVSSGQGATNELGTPLQIYNNDFINFRTLLASGTAAPCVVTAWLKYVMT